MHFKSVGRILTAALLASAPVFGAAAQEAEGSSSAPVLSVELNALQSTDKGCRFTFVVANQLGGALESAAFELVLFDKAGMVSRLTIVDFKDLPDGKTKVRQFDFSGVDCASLGRVLVNDATECKGSGIDARACIENLKTETRTDTAFGI
jgi:hypothetical protein